jgi:hypothetical protein
VPAGGNEAQKAVGVSQFGITWAFAAPAQVGRYVTGDWWVVGPVTVRGISPSPGNGRNGSVVNPPAGDRQGYDERLTGYDAALAAKLPLELQPGQSLVSTMSMDKLGQETPETVPGQYAKGPVRTAAVLTCVEKPPEADAFRPAYVGQEKLTFRARQLRRDLLPRLKPAGALPDLKLMERYLQRIWLDHMLEWPSRDMHPLENMPDYGREITTIVSDVSLMLLMDDPQRRHEALLLKFVQLGIDYYGVTQSNNDLWRANGGHNSGRKMPIIFAGVLLDHEGMKHVKAAFAEDQQTYYGQGYRGQKALWRIDNTEERQHEQLPPEKWAGPPFKGDNDGWKSEGYRGLNGPTWPGEALAARLLGAKAYWDHDAFFDYVDRWVKEQNNGLVDLKTKKPTSYKPFATDFARGMWQAYRDKADEIGARALEKAKAGGAPMKVSAPGGSAAEESRP